jgi:hypothetical protein
MANQAKVSSLDALERFRANLIIFRTKAHRALEMAADEVRRTQSWLQGNCRAHWDGEIRRRRKVLEQAEADLHSARLTGMQESAAVKRAAVNKAKRAVDEAEDKMRNVRKWIQRFGGQADQLVKMLGPLREITEHSLPDGIAFLAQAQKTLEAYTEVQYSSSGPATTGETKPEVSPEPE